MKADLAEKLCCPAPGCGAVNMTLQAVLTERLNYRTGAVDEVREGALSCSSCGRAYPISEYILSFESLYPADLLEEADYWSRWYGFWWERKELGFFDLNAPRALLITQGIEVPDPSSVGTVAGQVTHPLLTGQPLLAAAREVLDVGCGTGWSSLLLAQQGHEVVSCDPSAANMRLAKQYAISQGEHIEYIGAALGYLSFKPCSFDGVVALHSIHHVPDVRREIEKLCGWLRPDGVIAVDEHIGTNKTLLAISRAMSKWADAEIYPKVRTLDQSTLQGLPEAGNSALEGAGTEELIQALLDNFSVESFASRYVSLDFFSFLYYLWRDQEPAAYHYSADVLAQLSRLLVDAFPEGAEYVTLVGKKEFDDGIPGKGVRQVPSALPLGSGDELSPEQSRLRTLMLKAERATNNRRLAAMEREVEALRQNLGAKESHIEELNAWAASLQGEIKAKNRELGRQARLLSVLPPGILKGLDAWARVRKRRRKK